MKKLVPSLALCLALGVASVPLPAAAHDDSTPFLEQALSVLPRDKAEDFKDALQQAHEDNKDLYEQARQVREEMHQMLMAETFDSDAFVDKSEELRQIHDKISANLDTAFAQAASDLTPHERRTLARALEHEHWQKKAVRKAAMHSQRPMNSSAAPQPSGQPADGQQ